MNENESLAAPERDDRIWTANFVLMILANCFIVNSYLMLSPTFPLYLKSLGNAEDIIGLLSGIFTVTAMLSRPLAGRVLDSGRRKQAFAIGQIICVAACLLYPWVRSFLPLLLLRLVHGIGIGFTTTAANTIAADFIPNRRMAEGIGYFGISTVMSMAIAPGLGLYVFGAWNDSLPLFYTSACLAAVSLVLGLLVRHNLVRHGREAAAAPKRAEPARAFVRMFERNAVMPSVVVFFLAISFSVISTFLALFAAERNIGGIGWFFTVFAATTLVTRPAAGRLADRTGYGFTIIPGMVVVAVSMFVLASADHLFTMLLAAAMFGIGYGSAQSSLQAMAVRDAAPIRRGAAVGTFYLGLDLSIGIGALAAGTVAKQIGYASMFRLATVPVAVSLAIYLWFAKKRARAGRRQEK
jgi:Arabinose efflux permease